MVDVPAAVAVELPGVEPERAAGDGTVAGEAFGLGGVVPGLLFGDAGVVDGKGLIRAGFGDEVGIGVVGAPFVGDAINAGGGFDDEACFEAADGGFVAARHFHVEVFHPDHAGGEGPVAGGVEADGVGGVGDHEPALFEGVVGPETDIGGVSDEAVGGFEGLEIFESCLSL